MKTSRYVSNCSKKYNISLEQSTALFKKKNKQLFFNNRLTLVRLKLGFICKTTLRGHTCMYCYTNIIN